tara:strand:+ start:18 stop:770 length:753 start_codon:yes stop_codon:yes gene_type:complete
MSKTTIPTGGITADAINATLVTDDAISDEHLDVTAVTGQTAITSLADTDKFLVSDASDSGNLKYVEKQYLGGGALVKTGQITLGSNTSITLDNCFTSDYETYLMILSDINATADDQTLQLRFRTGGGSGSTDTASQYRYACRYFDDDGGLSSNTGVDQDSIRIADGSEESADWKGYNGTFTVYQPQLNTSTRMTGHGSFVRNTASDEDIVASYNAMHYDSDAQHTGIFLYYSSGDIRSGAKVIVYGVSEA